MSRFLLAVEPISASGVESIQSTATRFIKRCLNLPWNATQAILFHPTMLNCPHLKSEKVNAKISQLAALYSTTDKTSAVRTGPSPTWQSNTKHSTYI